MTRPDTIRRNNLSLLLGHVHGDGPLTRAELTQRLDVSRSTIGALVGELATLGLIEESVPGGGAGVGRPSHVVGPHPRGPVAVAVDVDVSRVTVAAVALGGDVVARAVLPTPASHSPAAVARLIARSFPRLLAEHCPQSWPAGLGVSVPGTVDRLTGHIGVAPNLGWRDAPFGAALAKLVPSDIPIVVGNDADLAVKAEHRRGSARGCDDVVLVLGRVGVGAGIILGGQQLRGHDGHAGEIGHDVVDPSGPECHCGKHGCLETYVGDAALVAGSGSDADPTEEAVAQVYAEAAAGGQLALDSVSAVAASIGRALATLVNTLNPQRILLAGSLAALLDAARDEIEAALAEYALEVQGRTVQIVRPELGRDSALLGAAEIAFEPLLTDPLRAAARLGA